MAFSVVRGEVLAAGAVGLGDCAASSDAKKSTTRRQGIEE
jgi:hypothetical protein